MPRYFVIYKPFGMLTQFSGEGNTLGNLGDFPPDVYPVGRLDKDSEGLLIISNDKTLNHRLLDPVQGHRREYFVQVEGDITHEALHQLESGLLIQVDKRAYRTKKAVAKSLKSSPILPERVPPVRYRKTVPDSWISLTLTEGKNRQVRKMTAAAGFPTLRLVRWAIEDLTIKGFESGQVEELSRKAIYSSLGILER
ncbi:pseudouridine synthase [Lunatibacter salilacus]|uniref:pseudouridine synthase n=1 Tax=Lunatibacter salilacus TaxID=2483804 RepID=UPI00131BEA51|nr:pseudouridine synthase [Lunatibacter salilacus]